MQPSLSEGGPERLMDQQVQFPPSCGSSSYSSWCSASTGVSEPPKARAAGRALAGRHLIGGCPEEAHERFLDALDRSRPCGGAGPRQ